jgi:hypothetical protein
MVDPAITLLLRAWDVAKAFHGKAPELSLPSALRFSQPFGRLFLLFFVELFFVGGIKRSAFALLGLLFERSYAIKACLAASLLQSFRRAISK